MLNYYTDHHNLYSQNKGVFQIILIEVSAEWDAESQQSALRIGSICQ